MERPKLDISIILPTLNEAQGIAHSLEVIKGHLEQFTTHYEIIIVDDNSPDGTIDIVKGLQSKDARIKYIQMSRRFGDQICLMAGIEVAKGNCVVTMDADLQHPPRYLQKMYQAFKEGNEVVIMIREKEGHNSWFKTSTEIAFYQVLSFLSDSTIYYRFSGFCLLSKKAASSIALYKESEPFIRGLIGLIGFKVLQLPYIEEERTEGYSKYNLYRMFKLAFSALVGFSTKPLYLSLYLGVITILLSLGYSAHVLYHTLLNQTQPAGWASIICLISFLGGVQLLTLGIVGLYLSKVFVEVKQRPLYIAKESGL